jgi:hypothetical protein
MKDPRREGGPDLGVPSANDAERVEPLPAPPLSRPRRSLGALADTVGHCVLVFAFVPALIALPEWLYAEATRAPYLRCALVVGFLPVRAMVALLDAFRAGIVPGAAAGVLDGVLLSLWFRTAGSATRPRALLVGGLCGGSAAGVVVLAAAIAGRGLAALNPAAVAFALAVGVACGMIAAPAAARFWARPAYDPGASVSGSQ